MEHNDIVIIGAGASGLIAARALAAGGRKVCLLEGRDRIGGRIHTLQDPLFPPGTEAGAEFIHGNLEITKSLVKEAGLSYPPAEGEFWQVNKGEWSQPEDFVIESDLLINHLKKLKNDMSIADFLQQEFPGNEHEAMKRSLLRFVEGYDAADSSRASAIAFREEWMSETDEQYRVKGGYSQLMDFLHQQFHLAGGITMLNSIVKNVQWKKHKVKITTTDNKTYTARQAIITIPLGIWQAEAGCAAAITFFPSPEEKIMAAKQMGFGSVIKILLQFREAFWEDADLMQYRNKKIKNLGFIFSDSPIPTWWTQFPAHVPLLTGWLAGPQAARWKNVKDEDIREEALGSVAYIFAMDKSRLQEKLVAARIFNWAVDPFTCGAYTYATTATREARKILSAPIEDTLFFAGEALYEGPEMGTVEAALASGLKMAASLLKIRTHPS